MATEPLTHKRNYLILIMTLIFGVGVFVNIGYTTVVEDRRKAADRAVFHRSVTAQCKLVKAVLDAYESYPPVTTPTGLNVQAAWKTIYDEFGCEHL